MTPGMNAINEKIVNHLEFPLASNKIAISVSAIKKERKITLYQGIFQPHFAKKHL